MASNGRGTMAPGQTVSVNKYSVQVERYLSQGGFAHVYLVRTTTPVYNTTHHVLKRIAVANDAMLTEVKKEVDIMRILKGHPNIVHLIDAAWHRMSNGTYEVFILMEFCPGGGIIDMMNRRLRERLTEAEILTIFVDVCEGVAAMHNLRPALLHRDLKVENILQASATSYKLCDFGSATSVAPKPPSTTQEIRALEADLNKYTTLQYRAPEMVDPYLRRPVDEKSDVWALGVLLYKLCYYTTPFEEHGPLAILNVQYKIPPYPIYSSQMNSLIASMLREYGTQRPSIFEILDVVHRIRGTKSRFSYTIPEKQPLSPRTVTSSSNFSTLDDLATFKSQPTFATKNAGTQARDKVLEAIAPMRRGRPTRDLSRSPSPSKDRSQDSWMNGDFSADFDVKDQEWKKLPRDNVNKSGVAGSDAWKVQNSFSLNNGLETRSDIKSNLGFDNDFSGKGDAAFLSAPTVPKHISSPIPIPARSSQTTSSALSSDLSRLGALRSLKSKDAFDGLGLSEKPPAPTLGEVRKARTGLAVPLEYSFNPRRLSPQLPPPPSSSPHRTSLPFMSTPQSKLQNLTIEERFPSVEELDRRIFGGSSASPFPSPRTESKTTSFGEVASRESSLAAPVTLSNTSRGITGASRLAVEAGKPMGPSDGHRPQNVTVTAMRDSRIAPTRIQENNTAATCQATGDTTNSQITGRSRSSRPSLTRKHRSSIIVKRSSTTFDMDADPVLRKEASMQSLATSRDWLTGEDEGHDSDLISRVGKDSTSIQGVKNSGVPVLRESPSKRASFIAKSPHLIVDALEGDVDEGVLLSPPTLPPRPSSGVSQIKQASSVTSARKPPPLVDISPSPTGKAAVAGGSTDNWSPIATDITTSYTENNFRLLSLSSDSDEDEGPEDVNGYGSLTGKNRNQVQQRESKANPAGKAKRRQSSVHDLVDLWGGSRVLNKEKERSSKNDLSPSEQKRRSVILPSSTSTAYIGTLVGSPSPQSMSTHATTLQNLSIGSSPRGPNKSVVAPSLKSTHSTSSGQTRSRPQSMLAFPSSKPVVEGTGSASPGLAAPPEGLRTISASRRTSISDMVQRYEEIGVSTRLSFSGGYAGFAPSILTKSAGLNIPTNEDPVPIGPGNSSPRYINNVKVLGSDPSVSEYHQSRGRSRRTSPVGIRDGTSPKGTVEYANKKSITTTDSIRYDSQNTKVNSENDIVSGADPQSSPERPFVGVSKLIDQWQKKAEESNSGGRNR